MAVDADENAYANNEFTIYLDGNDPLRITRQPRDVTIQEGEDAVFSVEAAGGKPPYAYQWQAWDARHGKWIDLPGSTGAALSRKNVKRKWDGLRVRCVVTDAGGAKVVSSEAVLRVRARMRTGDHTDILRYLLVAVFALAILRLLRPRREREG